MLSPGVKTWWERGQEGRSRNCEEHGETNHITLGQGQRDRYFTISTGSLSSWAAPPGRCPTKTPWATAPAVQVFMNMAGKQGSKSGFFVSIPKLLFTQPETGRDIRKIHNLHMGVLPNVLQDVQPCIRPYSSSLWLCGATGSAGKVARVRNFSELSPKCSLLE